MASTTKRLTLEEAPVVLNLFLSPYSVMNTETSLFSAKTYQSFFFIFDVCVENTIHLPLNSELC